MKQGREGDHQQSRATQSRNGQSRESMLSESQEKVLPGKGCALGQSGRDQTGESIEVFKEYTHPCPWWEHGAEAELCWLQMAF